ncbi:MAG TPA: polyphosphate kinase 1 [Chitinophagaceae bacterium]|jgi:polyphosphate kinase|nr:polyphosphate kinase 1 [Chitinophagaceae bacterium]
MFYNRELSWLGFNYRVLQEAASPSVPLFERLKFLSIFSSNLDEFFRVRYPAVLALSSLKRKTQKQIAAENPGELIEAIHNEITRQLLEFGHVLDDVLPELKKNGIHLYYSEPIKEIHSQEMTDIFLSQVLSFIQPLLLDGKSKFNPANNQLYFAISLKKNEEELIRHAVVNIPSDKLPRFFILSPDEGMNHVVFIDDIIRENMQVIFPGFEILGIYSFKINRDAELNLEEEYHVDMLKKIERQLNKRNSGQPSRFLFEKTMPLNIQLFFTSVLGLKLDEMFGGGRYHNLKDFIAFPSFGKKLLYNTLEPVQRRLVRNGDIFNLVLSKDVLLHFPYHSYNTILSFFNQAAIDPDVSEIYIALYRVASESHIANALISAARNGKKVTAFLELKARFDEQNNIQWSKKMKEAGVKLIYSIPGIKVHSKIALVKKQNKESVIHYSVLSTGNFNEITAKFYTDHILLTTNTIIGNELQRLFKFLGERRLPVNAGELKFKRLLVSQFNMIERFNELIEKEITKQKKGVPALIRIKLNNLEEQGMINSLYKASRAGVKIQLIIRGICCIIPSLEDLSENIVVKRIVDRYLEHSRIFIFGTSEDCEVMIGSADWMSRNLHRRIEVCVPIEDTTSKKELIDYFEMQWNDNDKSVIFDEQMQQIKPETNDKTVNAQQSIYNYIKEQ